MENAENNKKLILFLRDLAYNIENNKLSPLMLQQVGEFYMTYEMFSSGEQIEYENKIQNDEEFHPSDMLKFITLGWYIYQIILQENIGTEPDPPDLDLTDLDLTDLDNVD